MFDLIGKAIDTASEPFKDGLDVLDGLSEGELRVRAALRLGVDLVAGMTAAEIIEALKELDNE